MKKIVVLIVNKILLTLSFFPIFAIVDRTRFMNAEYSYDEKQKDFVMRDDGNVGMCFINIRLGGIAIQFMGMHHKGLTLSYLANIEEFNTGEFTKEFFEEKERDYERQVAFLPDEDLRIEEKSLDEHIKFYESAIKKINDKFKSLQTLALALAPGLCSIMLSDQIKALQTDVYMNYIINIYILFDVYILMNIILLMIQFYAVKPRVIEGFNALKISNIKQRKYVVQKYMNWLYLRPLHTVVAAYADVYKGMIEFAIMINSFVIIYYIIIKYIFR